MIVHSTLHLFILYGELAVRILPGPRVAGGAILVHLFLITPGFEAEAPPPQGARLTLPRVLAGALHSFPSSFHALSWQLSFPQPYGARDILGLAAICTGRRRGHCRAAAAFGGPTWFPGTSQIASARTTGTILPSPCPMPMPLLVPLLLPPYSGRQGAGMAGNTIVLSMPPLSRLVAFWHEHTS